MKNLISKGRVLALIFCLPLISCSGGGGGGWSAGGGIDGTGIMSAGTVSAFGSIIVNGTEFDTSKAVIIINGKDVGFGDEVARDNLDIGGLVTVEGRINEDGSAVADRVIYSDNVVGPLESIRFIDTTTKEIVVLGQIVIVNVITKFKETNFDSLVKDDVVEVSGYFDEEGNIRATFLEKTGVFTSGLIVKVEGSVKNLNVGLDTFEINGLTVNYALIANSLPEGIPADDLLVEVEGTVDTPGGEMLATEIELGDVLDGEDGDELEIMGFVTSAVSAFEFKIGNQLVTIDADTVVVDELSGGIRPGVKLEAEGSLEGGILFAWEIEFWKPDQAEVEGVVTNIVSDSEFMFAGLLVQTSPGTIFENGKPADIALGVRLEVKGIPLDFDHSIMAADKVSFEYD